MYTRTFPGTAASVPEARHWLTGLLGGLPAVGDAGLCLSELATNAIGHSQSGQPGGTFTVRVTLTPALHVEVADQGGLWAPHPDPDGLRGRGLAIVAQLTSDCGITGGGNGRTAWFTLATSHTPHPSYRIDLPRADGMRLAGIGLGWPATPEGRCVHAITTWLTGLERRSTRAVLVTKISRDLWPLLEAVPLTQPPRHGPFASPAHGGSPLPGHVEYLGAGTVRLDSAALSALAELSDGDDFRVSFTSTGPVMTIGTERYPAREEEPSSSL